MLEVDNVPTDGDGSRDEETWPIVPVGALPTTLLADVDVAPAVEAAVDTTDDGLGVASSLQFFAAVVTPSP
jgi:hypothetical protein